MLDSLQLHVRLVLSILTIVTFSQVSAYEMSASPYEIIIETEPNREVCRTINIEADSEKLNVQTTWSSTESRVIETFTLSAETVNMKTSYPRQIAGPETQFSICLETFDSYAHYGLIAIEDPTKHAGLEVWLIINPDNPEKRTVKQTITGSTIAENKEKQENVSIATYLLIGTTLLTLALAFLILKIRKKQERNPNPY